MRTIPIEALATVLRNEKYVQGTGRLCTQLHLEGSIYQRKFCCLGVAADFFNVPYNDNDDYPDNKQIAWSSINNVTGLNKTYDSSNSRVPHWQHHLARLNDQSYTFSVIADILENPQAMSTLIDAKHVDPDGTGCKACTKALKIVRVNPKEKRL